MVLAGERLAREKLIKSPQKKSRLGGKGSPKSRNKKSCELENKHTESPMFMKRRTFILILRQDFNESRGLILLIILPDSVGTSILNKSKTVRSVKEENLSINFK